MSTGADTATGVVIESRLRIGGRETAAQFGMPERRSGHNHSNHGQGREPTFDHDRTPDGLIDAVQAYLKRCIVR